MSNETSVTVGVFGHYGNENLGDEAIVEAVIQAVRAQWAGAQILAFSINPADTTARYGVPAYPIRKYREPTRCPNSDAMSTMPLQGSREARDGNMARVRRIAKTIPLVGFGLHIARLLLDQLRELFEEAVFLRRSFRQLKGVDLLLVAGSNQFLDNFGGSWGFPYTLLKWSILAKLRGAKLAFISVGAGPIDSPLSRALVRLALSCSGYTSFRDAASKRLIETKTFRMLGPVCPDLAHGLALNPPRARADITPDVRPVVGINPMPMYDPRYWCEVDIGKYRHYVTQLAHFASVLLREGFPVFFFPTQAKDENVIGDIISTLDADVRGQAGTASVRKADSVYGLMKVYAAADVIIATRFHGTLLALLAERPVLGICYYRKTRDLLKEMGQEDYAVDLDGLEATDLLKRFKALVADYGGVSAKIRQRNEEYRAQLHAQYQQVFSLVRSPQAVVGRAVE